MTLILALYGFPSAIARIAVTVGKSRHKVSLTHFVLPLFLLLAFINGLMAFILWKNAHSLAQFVGDGQLAPAFEKVAFVFLLIPFTALLRGVFQSQIYMQPIAFSQVSEQVVRVFVILAAAIFYSLGKLPSIYNIGEWAA